MSNSLPQAVLCSADEAGNLKLTDFSIAEYAAELAEDQADRRNLLKGGQPTGGFHKRHLVRSLLVKLHHCLCTAQCWLSKHVVHDLGSTACCVQVGTLQYLAPEILLKQPASYAADIYAWAVTVNEVATGTFPFSDCTHDNPQAHTILDFGYGRWAPPQANHCWNAVWKALRDLIKRACLQVISQSQAQ